MGIKPWLAGLSLLPALLSGCSGSSCFLCKDGSSQKKPAAPLPAWQTAPAKAPMPPSGAMPTNTGTYSPIAAPKSVTPNPLSMAPPALSPAPKAALAPAPIQPVGLPEIPSAPGIPATSLNAPPPPSLTLPEPTAPYPADPGPALPPISAGAPNMLPPPPGAPSLDPAPLSIPAPPVR